jgi:hypothetical protein
VILSRREIKGFFFSFTNKELIHQIKICSKKIFFVLLFCYFLSLYFFLIEFEFEFDLVVKVNKKIQQSSKDQLSFVSLFLAD